MSRDNLSLLITFSNSMSAVQNKLKLKRFYTLYQSYYIYMFLHVQNDNKNKRKSHLRCMPKIAQFIVLRTADLLNKYLL